MDRYSMDLHIDSNLYYSKILHIKIKGNWCCMDEAEESKIIRDLELRIEERRRQVYGSEGTESSGWPIIAGVVSLAIFIFIIGIFVIGFDIFGHRQGIGQKTQRIGKTPLQIEDKTK